MPARVRTSAPQGREMGPMTHPKGAIWTERLLVVMVLASLAGALNLVLAVHRRSAISPSVADSSDGTAPRLERPTPPPIPLIPARPSSPVSTKPLELAIAPK